MRGRGRLAAALAVAVLCAPGTFVRTEASREPPRSIALARIAGASAAGVPSWEVAGVWQYSTGPTLKFGGFSALLPLSSGRLRTYSDRGFVFTFTEPDQPRERASDRKVTYLPIADPELYPVLWDIESAAHDFSGTGDYWLGFENTHAIHRFSFRSEAESYRILEDEVEWYANGGLEAMVRLSDGRFLAKPESSPHALLFAGDPVESWEPRLITFDNPAPGFAVTDMAQLPDGRVLLLMRDVVLGVPPFAGLLAIADPPASEQEDGWSPEIIFRFDGVLPPENYEGIAVREMEDGRVAVWIISDDNVSVMQRTLLAKLIYDPSAPGD